MSLFPKRINGLLTIGICATAVAGCSASGGRSALPPQPQGSVLTTQSTKSVPGSVKFAIGIKPEGMTGRIAPQYVSQSTQSLQILADGAKPVVVNLTPSSPNCAPNPAVAGAYTCTASLNVPAGSHVFTVTTYDLADAKGNVLSTNSTGTVDVKPTGITRLWDRLPAASAGPGSDRLERASHLFLHRRFRRRSTDRRSHCGFKRCALRYDVFRRLQF